MYTTTVFIIKNEIVQVNGKVLFDNEVWILVIYTALAIWLGAVYVLFSDFVFPVHATF